MKHIDRSRNTAVRVALCGLMMVLASNAQDHPDFTGIWRLKVDQSSFGAFPKPTNRIDMITHREAQIRDVATVETGGKQRVDTMDFTTDGNVSENVVNGVKISSTAKWNGRTLEMRNDAVGSAVRVTDLWTLSPDGLTLTVKSTIQVGMNSGEILSIYERVKAKESHSNSPFGKLKNRIGALDAPRKGDDVREVANAQARVRSHPQGKSPQQVIEESRALSEQERNRLDFITNLPLTTFRTACFSGICIGDDLEALGKKNIEWISPPESKYKMAARTLDSVGAAVRGLSASDQRRIIQSLAFDDGLYGFGAFFGWQTRSGIYMLQSQTIRILNTSRLCSFAPLFGVFKSEAGHLTGVYMLPYASDSKPRVVFMRRIFTFATGGNALTNEQEMRTYGEQFTGLVKQLDERFGTTWSSQLAAQEMAVGEKIVAYITWPNNVSQASDADHAWMSIYDKSFAMFQAYQSHTLMPDRHLRLPGEESIVWERIAPMVNQLYSQSEECRITPNALKID